jgi:hypothetical protein
MFEKYPSDNRPMCLNITIKCSGNKAFRVWAEDSGKPNSKYADRQILVEGERTIYFSFPVSPKELFIGIVNTSNHNDADFSYDIKEVRLKDYSIALDRKTRDFLNLAIYFSQVCGFSPATQNGSKYETEDGEYKIKFFDVIRDVVSGRVMNTPARIGHKTGNIEVAQVKFDKYTVPMRVMILLHEYSHKYKNPKIGLPISHEIGADINGLYIYLGLGFSKIDAICVFANVFLKAQTPQNIERMRKITDYIQRFENQEYAQLN